MEELLQQTGPVLARLNPQPVEMPARVRSALHLVLDRKFPLTSELTQKEMETLLLKVLAEKPMDGFELIRGLEKARIQHKDGGEGVIYGLLANLESAGHLEARWRESGNRMIKLYHVTDQGAGLLEPGRAAHPQLSAWSQLVLSST